MNNLNLVKRKGLCAIIGVVAAFGTLLMVPTGNLLAQEGESAEAQQETRRTGSMGEKVYRKLAEAQELADAENWGGAQRALDEIKAMPKLTPYEKAQLYNFYGFVYYSQDRFRDSIRAYETVLATPDIPPGLREQTKYTVAQLHFTTENWGKAISMINDWLATANNPGPEPYILLGSAYYQTNNFAGMVRPIEKAMSIARERNMPVKEQWWLLLRVAYYEQNNFKKVRDILQVLVINWPKKEYWTQLSAIYGELGDEKRQLAAYQSAYDQGLLVRSNELVQLSQLLLQAEVPFKAGKILEKGLNDGAIDKTSDNYRLLSQAWQLSGEDRKAIPALKTAASMSGSGDLNIRLAQSHLNLSEFPQCIEAARAGLRKGGVRRPDTAQVVLGMCLYEAGQQNEAKAAFRKAAGDSRSQKSATQWITFIEREQERQRQLDESLKKVRTASLDAEDVAEETVGDAENVAPDATEDAAEANQE